MSKKGKRTIAVQTYQRRRPRSQINAKKSVHVHAHNRRIQLPAPKFHLHHVHYHQSVRADVIGCNPRTDTVILRTEKVASDGSVVDRGKRTYAISVQQGVALKKVAKPEAPVAPINERERTERLNQWNEAERKRKEARREKKWLKAQKQFLKEDKSRRRQYKNAMDQWKAENRYTIKQAEDHGFSHEQAVAAYKKDETKASERLHAHYFPKKETAPTYDLTTIEGIRAQARDKIRHMSREDKDRAARVSSRYTITGQADYVNEMHYIADERAAKGLKPLSEEQLARKATLTLEQNKAHYNQTYRN